MLMDLMTKLGELGKISKAPTPLVSVYLNPRWADEHQRDRVRDFLKNELAWAGRASSNRAADSDLDWIEFPPRAARCRRAARGQVAPAGRRAAGRREGGRGTRGGRQGRCGLPALPPQGILRIG
jgi:hypothetical protein